VSAPAPGGLRAAWLRDGVLPSVPVLRPTEAAAVLRALQRIEAREQDARQGAWTDRVFEPWHQDDHPLRDWAHRLARHPSLLAATQAVLGPEVLLRNTDVFVKAPHGHDQVAWHVDTAATGPVCDEMLTLWLALTPASPDTGAVTYALGSHRQPLPTHADDRFGLVLTAQGVAALDRRRVRRANGPPGTANLHHLRTAHRSGPNHTDGRRVAVVVRYLTPRATPEAADCGRVVVLSGDDAGPFEATDHAPVFWSGPT